MHKNAHARRTVLKTVTSFSNTRALYYYRKKKNTTMRGGRLESSVLREGPGPALLGYASRLTVCSIVMHEDDLKQKTGH